jgi:hypothetical protein
MNFQKLISFHGTMYKHLFDKEKRDPDPKEVLADLLECRYSSNFSVLNSLSENDSKEDFIPNDEMLIERVNSKDELMLTLLR